MIKKLTVALCQLKVGSDKLLNIANASMIIDTTAPAKLVVCFVQYNLSDDHVTQDCRSCQNVGILLIQQQVFHIIQKQFPALERHPTPSILLRPA